MKEEQLFRFLSAAFVAALIAGSAIAPAGAALPAGDDSAKPAAATSLAGESSADWTSPEYHLIAPDTRLDARDADGPGQPATAADFKMWLGDGKPLKSASLRRFAKGIVNRTSAIARGLTRDAMRFIGTPYVFGGTSPSGFDCSGYVQHVFAMVGIRIPRTADVQYYAAHKIKGSMVAGDLVFFQTYEPGPSHVGIYLGDGKFVHASSHGVRVSRLRDSYWAARYLGAKRVLVAKAAHPKGKVKPA